MTSAADAISTNNQMRAALLATAPRMRKKLGTFGPFQPGENMRQKLFNVGIGTSIDVEVSATVTVTAALTASPKAPFNLLDKVLLTDYDGTDRVNCTGHQLFVNRSVNQQASGLFGYQNSAAKNASVPLVNVPAAATGTLRFGLKVPLAYRPESDLRGAMLMQTAVGESFLSLNFNASGVGADADSVYSAGTGTVTDIYVTVYQNYLSPLAIGNSVPLPSLDLQTVYELNGSLKSSDSLAVGTEKLLNYPNVRTVLGLQIGYMNAGAMNAQSTDLTGLRLLANGNTVIQEWSAYGLAAQQREELGCDLPVGIYYLSSRSRPIETQLYGNVQAGFTPAAMTAGNTYLDVLFESFYSKGATLPGMTQG